MGSRCVRHGDVRLSGDLQPGHDRVMSEGLHHTYTTNHSSAVKIKNIFRPQVIENYKKQNHGQRGWLYLDSSYSLHLANKADIEALNCAALQKSG